MQGAEKLHNLTRKMACMHAWELIFYRLVLRIFSFLVRNLGEGGRGGEGGGGFFSPPPPLMLILPFHVLLSTPS